MNTDGNSLDEEERSNANVIETQHDQDNSLSSKTHNEHSSDGSSHETENDSYEGTNSNEEPNTDGISLDKEENSDGKEQRVDQDQKEKEEGTGNTENAPTPVGNNKEPGETPMQPPMQEVKNQKSNNQDNASFSSKPPTNHSPDCSSYISDSPQKIDPVSTKTVESCSDGSASTGDATDKQFREGKQTRKKRISRFLNIGKTPIITKNSLRKRLEKENMTEEEVKEDEIFARLDKSVRMLRKQTRERNRIKYARPKKVVETMNDLETVGNLRGFTKVEKSEGRNQAETRSGNTTSHQ